MTQKEGPKLFLESLVDVQERENFEKLNWEGSFSEYLEIIRNNPKVTRSSFQRIHDMVLFYGYETREDFKKEKVVHYNFFDDPVGKGTDAVFGLDKPLMNLVNLFKAAAEGYGIEKRILLLHGPVGSSKSTIARLLKKGLEAYTKTDEGALYTFGWKNGEETEDCPMHDEPLLLIPNEGREKVLNWLNDEIKDKEDSYKISIFSNLCPPCRLNFKGKLKEYNGDWSKVLDDVKVKRLVFSEEDRVGIGTFQPKDEKNQDSTELTGDINYRKIAEYGSDSDPRAFNFDGELNISNRGFVELIEVLKLDVAFLYDLLGASQEHSIKPKKFAQVSIDEVLLGHTNEPEYKKLQTNEFMEALRDRTVKIDIPYVIKHSDEVQIYKRDFNSEKVKNKHIAPHTLEMAALWAVLTRIEDPKHANLTTRLQKLKLYDGKHISGFTQDNIEELVKETTHEGMEGISPRYVQDKISEALVTHDEPCVNPFMVMKELESGLKNHSLINSETKKKEFQDLISVTREEYEDTVKDEVRRAIAADRDALDSLCGKYIDNVRAYTQKEKVRDKFTGKDIDPDEKIMRSIEEKVGNGVGEARKDDFRQQIMNYIGSLALKGKKFDYSADENLRKALELKLFEDKKDSIKLTSLVSEVIDEDSQKKIDVIKERMIRDYGYCDVCSTDVLNFVASIFARGDPKD
jgi:serine protein kinase